MLTLKMEEFQIAAFTEWQDRRIVIASLFLPIAATQNVEKRSKMQDEDLADEVMRRVSLVSAISSKAVKARQQIMSLQKTKTPLVDDALGCTTEPCIYGNIGLQNAVNSVKEVSKNMLWIGLPGNEVPVPKQGRVALSYKLRTDHRCEPVFVTKEEFDGHYNQFCKQVLWKPFHYQLPDFPNSKAYEQDAWNQYVAVNRKFAEKIAEVYQDGDIVWINDYHLMLVPLMLRKLVQTATIGFFLHIPFPSSEVFRCLHVRKQILEGMLGADLIGFQTYAFMRHFVMTTSRLLSLESSLKGIQLENSVCGLGIYPIGINLDSLNEKRNQPEVAEIVALLKEKYAGKHIVIGRDKNDYVKGVRQKLLAFERFLTFYPQWQGRVVLIQVALSTTEANEMECNVSDVISRINSNFGTFGYDPVVYLHQDISFNNYLALLTIADACLITSLRDGMNLTSHEYVVCQQGKYSPLIISEFAGTYSSFGVAIRINPWDKQEVANAIHEALTMSAEDKRYRWEMLFRYVSTNSSQYFVESFVSDTAKVHEENMSSLSTSLPPFIFESIHKEYTSSNRKIFLLDDYGTLLTDFPDKDSPSGIAEVDNLKLLLQSLCSDHRNIVYLMSGRSRADLSEFFAIPHLGVCAENGCFIKFADQIAWEPMLFDLDLSWREKVIEIFEYYSDRTPGSTIEQMEVGLAWHYDYADMSFGAWQAAECVNHIQNALANSYPVHAISKKKCVEVTPRNVNKGTAVRRILGHHRPKQKKHHHHNHHHSHHPHFHLDHLHDSHHPHPTHNHHAFHPYEEVLSHSSGNQGERHVSLNEADSDRLTISTHDPRTPIADCASTKSLESGRNLSTASSNHNHDRADFVICIGDDRSDEYMFEFFARLEQYGHKGSRKRSEQLSGISAISSPGDSFARGDESSDYVSQVEHETLSSPKSHHSEPIDSDNILSATSSISESELKGSRRIIVTCTVGVKSSAAKFYVPSISNVLDGLRELDHIH